MYFYQYTSLQTHLLIALCRPQFQRIASNQKSRKVMNSWLFAVLLLFIPGSLSENPGLRAVITDKGLSFVCHTATDILEKALPSLPIPDITGSATFKVTFIKVTIDYSVTDIKINDLSIPGCSFTPSESGLTLGSSGISVEITAHVEAKHEGFPPLSASSDITVDLNDVSFSTTSQSRCSLMDMLH